MCSEAICVSSNDHPKNVVGVLRRYLDEETLVDCTVAAEGGCLKAHRVVLSACSTYFELLFGQEMKKEKVVLLEDIKLRDLKLLIAFMYESQVTIPKDRLRDFVRAAEFLQIRGLPNDLVQNSVREATEMSVVCAEEGLALQLSLKHSGRLANSGQSGHLQWVASISGNESGGGRHSTYMQTDLLEENVLLQPQCILDSANRETTVCPPEKVPSVEPKEEVDVEDTPIWESGDENTSAEADFSSATAGGVENELTPVSGTISSRSSFRSSPDILERESATSNPNFSSVSPPIPSSTNTASPSPLVPKVPTELSGGAMKDCFSSVHSELAEQSICVKTEPVVKTEVIPAVVSLHRESVVEPMHEVWVEELRPWDSEEVIAETCNQETTIQDLGAAGAHGNNQFAVRTNDIFKDFPSSHVLARKDKNAQEVKDETEVDEWCMGQECESIDAIESTCDRVVESSGQIAVLVHNDNLLNGEHEMKGQEIMVETLERALEADVAVEQSDAEDSAPLSEHVSKMLGMKLHRCRRCPGVFCIVSELRLHAKNVHKKKGSKRCEVCLATFACNSDLTRHMRTHTGERPFMCEVCGKSFSDRGSLTKHKPSHTGERPFKCEVCEKSFTRSSSLTTHKRIHTGERPFKCEVCEKFFSQSRKLSQHKLIHTSEFPFKCEVCEKSFNQSSKLSQHKLIHTSECPFKCGVCEMTFRLSSHLTNHKRIHSGERPFQCEVCERSFSVRARLTRHKLIHTGERSFHCDVCKRSFRVKETLITHMRTHTGERPFHCAVCKRAFRFKENLITHMRTHTGERPFLCNVCKRSFGVKESLITHMRTHTGERPFQCAVCKRAFRFKENLITHMRTHTGERPFLCNVCKKSFIVKCNLDRHMRTHTGD